MSLISSQPLSVFKASTKTTKSWQYVLATRCIHAYARDGKEKAIIFLDKNIMKVVQVPCR